MTKSMVTGQVPKPLPSNQLPTWEQVGLAVEDFKKNEGLDENAAGKEVSQDN